MICFAIINAIAFMCGLLWTALDKLTDDGTHVRVNYALPITYVLPGFAIGHYVMRFLLCK